MLFSDIDGTLVFYPEHMAELGTVTGPSSVNGILNLRLKEDERDHSVLLLPPSSTGMQGMISLRTLQLLAAWRSAGNLLVLVSGARTSTLLQRLAYLPAADAVVSENGGRVWLRDAGLPTATRLAEDWDWRAAHERVTGPVSQDAAPADARSGPLWDLYREMKADGWALDAHSYHTAFRVKVRPPKSGACVDELRARLPALALTSSYNLGKLDIYPAAGGKEGAAAYLMRHFGVGAGCCSFMCDDDNDLGLAAMLPRVFLPSVSSDTVRVAAEENPARFTMSGRRGVFGAEEALEHILGQCPASVRQAAGVM